MSKHPNDKHDDRHHPKPTHDPTVNLLLDIRRLLTGLLVWMKKNCCKSNAPPPSPDVQFSFEVAVSLKPKESAMPLEVSLSTEERVKVTVKPVTKAGKPAQLDGAPSFTSENPDVVIETIGGDPNSAFINATSVPGDAVVVVSADADLGEGVTTIQDTIVLHVADPEAASLGLTVGAPEPKA